MEVTIREDSQIADDMVDVCIDGKVFQSYFNRDAAEYVAEKIARKVNDLTECRRFFVYGTLKEGYRRGDILPHYGARKIADVRVENFTLLSHHNQFPAMIESSSDHVLGELYEASDNPISALSLLDELDIIEGVPRLYRREIVETDQGKAWTYVWNMSMKGLSHCGSIWPKRATQEASEACASL